MDSNTNKIDERIARLAEQQREMHAQAMAEFAEQRAVNQKRHEESMAEFARTEAVNQKRHEESMAEYDRTEAVNQKKHEESMAEWAEIKAAAKEQGNSIRSLAQTFAGQAKAYQEFSRSLPEMVEAGRRAAQASEGAIFMSQRTLEAIRDLIEELKEQRR